MSNLIRQGDANLAAFGQFGYKVIGNSEEDATGKVIVAIQSLDDETVIAANGENASVWPDISGLQLATGVTIFGRWKKLNAATVSVSSATGTSGKAIVYYGE